MCLARQVQVQNVKRHGPLQVLMSEDQMMAAAAAASGGKPQRFGAMAWPPQHSGQSLDSQLSKIQLAQAALEKADMFKVRNHSEQSSCSVTPCTCKACASTLHTSPSAWRQPVTLVVTAMPRA